MPSKIMKEAKAYKTRLESAVRQGRVDRNEVQNVLQEARAGSFSEVKAYYLASWVNHHRDAFDPASLAELNSFCEGPMASMAPVAPELGLTGPFDLGDPSLPEADRGGWLHAVRFKSSAQPAIVDGIGEDDLTQGALGDCYFLSSLEAVAATHPELLERSFRQLEDGSFEVDFYAHRDWESPAEKVTIPVRNAFPTKSGRLQYVGSRTGELWPMVFEKAFAKWKGGYEDVIGGMGANALSALTGLKPSFFPVMPTSDASEVFGRIDAVCKAGGCVVASSDAFGVDIPGLVPGHAYSVLGTREIDGERYVLLRNPWGKSEPGNDGKDDGIFPLPIEKFMQAYRMVEYVQP